MKRDYKLFMKDIIHAMESIEKFAGDMSQEEIAEDDMVSSAIIRKFEIIGEATKQIPDKLKKRYTEIPWHGMAGMRDRLIHAYFGIDYKLVWNTIRLELPKAKHGMQKILLDLEKEEKKE